MPYFWVTASNEDAMATELSITAKGQVTLKRAVLEHLGVRPGQ